MSNNASACGCHTPQIQDRNKTRQEMNKTRQGQEQNRTRTRQDMNRTEQNVITIIMTTKKDMITRQDMNCHTRHCHNKVMEALLATCHHKMIFDSLWIVISDSLVNRMFLCVHLIIFTEFNCIKPLDCFIVLLVKLLTVKVQIILYNWIDQIRLMRSA